MSDGNKRVLFLLLVLVGECVSLSFYSISPRAPISPVRAFFILLGNAGGLGLNALNNFIIATLAEALVFGAALYLTSRAMPPRLDKKKFS
jgi:hypothetical protein